MNTNFSSLATRTWNVISAHPKMAGIVFVYQFIPTLLFFAISVCAIICTTLILPKFGIDLSLPGVFESIILRFMSPATLLVVGIIGFLVAIALITLQLICSYLSRLGLAHMVQKKKFNFSSLLREWRGMWSWAGTGLATSVYFIATFIVTALLAIGCVYVYDLLALVPVILGGLVFVFLGISLAFTFPIYFFEGRHYFAATEKSREMVRGRWWKTFGNFFLLGLAIMFVSLVLFGLESGVQYILGFLPESLLEYTFITALFTIGAFTLMMLQSAINIIIQLMAVLYTFELYHDYNKTPVHSKK